jgi:hypothetical protein
VSSSPHTCTMCGWLPSTAPVTVQPVPSCRWASTLTRFQYCWPCNPGGSLEITCGRKQDMRDHHTFELTTTRHRDARIIGSGNESTS